MNHLDFFRAIKDGTLAGAYLLHGPEEYVKQSALTQLAQAMEQPALNAQVLEAPSAERIIEACETLPFFAPRRLVVVRALAGAEEEGVKEYWKKTPDTAILCIVRRGKADGRNALNKALTAAGRAIEFAPLTESEAVRFVQGRAVRLGAPMEPAVARHLVAMVGCDAAALEQELEKAAAYAGAGGAITPAVLAACVTQNLEYALFPVLDDLLGGRRAEGLAALSAMLRDRTAEPIPAAAALERQCRMALSARLLMDAGAKEERKIAERMGVQPFVARQAMALARRYDAPRLKAALAAFTDVEYNIKTGRAAEGMALDAAIWQMLVGS